MLAVFHATATVKKVKVANTRLPREGFRFLVVSLPVTYIVSHKPDDRLPLLSARPAVTPATLKRAATNFAAWMGVNSLPKTVTRQRRDCDLNPGLSAPEPSTLKAKFHYTDPTRTRHGLDPTRTKSAHIVGYKLNSTTRTRTRTRPDPGRRQSPCTLSGTS